MNSKINYLHAMGIPIWRERNSLSQDEVSFESLERTVKHCVKCPLHKTRKNTVFGMGNPASGLLFIGEGPGANEDQQGLPFVGRAGQLLDAMLHAIDLNRETCYITNIVKCRPPQNRDPTPEEIESCSPYLYQQIAFIKPKLIVALGRVAAHTLLKTQTSMSQLRGRMHFILEKIPLVVTYHPAYLLRNPIDKAHAMKDLFFISEFLKK